VTRPALVKVGGSVLTDKSTLKTPREGAFQRVAAELAAVDGPLVLVHGAGSYGHVRSSQWRVADGDAEATTRQAARVGADIAELGARLQDALAEAALAPLGLPPAPVAEARGGDLISFETAPFQAALEGGFLPVTRGDVVLDADQAFAAVSGDDLLAVLAEPLGARIAVFATDVPGILDEDGDVVPRMGPDAARGIGDGADAPDVTGGMAGKARVAATLAEAGVPVRIVDGTEKGRIRGALEGGPVTGTLVTLGGST
jgi:isopentenyl phosphate kinase